MGGWLVDSLQESAHLQLMQRRFVGSLCLAAFAILGCGRARASQIPFSGSLTLTQVGSPGSPLVNFAFSGLTVNGISGGDTLNGTAVVLTPSGAGFVLSGPVTSNGDFQTAQFSSSGGTVSVGNASTGTLTADIQFINLFADTQISGFFGVNIGLTSVVVTPGTSNLMNAWAGDGSGGRGGLTFSFSSGPQTLSDLLTLGAPGSNFSNPQWDSLQGSITVPEPATGWLLGTAMLGLTVLGWSGWRRREVAA